MQTIILYATVGCHLCEQAEELLRYAAMERELTWQLIDIADDPALVERYGIRIPVLRHMDGDDELGWPFELEQLQEFLDAGQ